VTKQWDAKRLEDVAYTSGRIGWKGLTAKEYTSGGPLFLSVHGLNYGDFVDFRDAFHISQERYDESPEIKLERSDILICKDGAGIGKLGIVGDLPGPATINSSLLLIRALSGVLPKFLYYALCSPGFQSIVQERIDGATTPHLYQREIKQFLIRLPSLPEQKRIVAILDEAFEGIDTAVANAEKNLANARELFENYLNSVFVQTGNEWTHKKLGGVATFKNGLNFTKGSKGETIKIVGVKDFQKNFTVPMDQLETAQIDGNLSADYELRPGDILTVRSNGNKQLIGRCMLSGYVPEKTSHSGFTIRIRVISGDVSPAYLVHFLKSKASREMLVESGDGANISSLNQQALATLPVSFPSLSKQVTITENIEAVAAETKSLESVYQQKLTAFSELKQAILQRAFSGELTARSAGAMPQAAE